MRGRASLAVCTADGLLAGARRITSRETGKARLSLRDMAIEVARLASVAALLRPRVASTLAVISPQALAGDVASRVTTSASSGGVEALPLVGYEGSGARGV